MKRILLSLLPVLLVVCAYSQTTYYWVAGNLPLSSANITTTSNWKTNIDGTGSSRVSATDPTDILVFDGTNIGGSVALTGADTVNINGSLSCGQLKLINNAQIRFIRATTGTSTFTISGDNTPADDFIVDAGSSFSIIPSTAGSIRIAMAANNTGRVNGSMSIITGQQARIDNTITGTAGSFVFTSGSTFTTNIFGSASYAFGNSTQSTERWVSFEAGANLYYDGGYSPNGSGNLFSAVDMKPGSIWHHRASNPLTGFGNFFNRKSYGNITVENNATLTALGPVYQIGNLTINAGSTFTTHSSGQTVVLGNLVVDGTLFSDVASTNELVMGSDAAQSISGTGSINIASLIIADNASVTLNKNISVDKTVRVYGRLDFIGNQVSGNAAFTANAQSTPVNSSGNLVAGRYLLSGNTGLATGSKGLTVTGAGIAPNTTVVATISGTEDTLYLSKPLLASGSGVAIVFASKGATLRTANSNGFDPATGSVVATGNKVYEDGINYSINAATSRPFGISTGSTATAVTVGFAEINAAVTANTGLTVNDYLAINAKISLLPTQLLHLKTGATFTGSIGSLNYINTGYDVAANTQATVQLDGLSAGTLVPIGTNTNYLPLTITPVTTGDYTASVFEGITTNGMPGGTPFTTLQKLTVVNAVWTINRLSGSGNTGLQLNWTNSLEGTTFSTLPDTDIGLTYNTGSSYSLPSGAANNSTNSVMATISTSGAYSVGAIPQSDPFVFNELPAKVYGDVDFNGGATSLNSSQPIVYTSNNTAVATIVNGDIHITGAGTATITASQASDGVYDAANIMRTLTVAKAALTITADSKTRFEATPNPTLTASYTGFVLGQTAAILSTPPVITTTAVLASAPGNYPITVTGAIAANYTISFVNGVLTVQPKTTQTITFTALAAKNYGNADFAAGATSTNATIPIVYTSSNTAVATISGSTIHITGAGTTNITAMQAGSDGYFAAANVVRALTVNKVPLAIRVRDTTRIQGQPNPVYTITYTGFVLGETAANLGSPATGSTTATFNSPAGYYPITLAGAASNNYTVTFTNARLTVLPVDGGSVQSLHAFMPNNTTLTVRVFSVQPGLADITLYTMNGQPVLKKNIFMPVGFISTDLLVSKLPAGIYSITIKGNGVDLHKRVAIIK